MSNERTIGKPTSPDATILHRPKSVNYLQGFWTTPIKRWWKKRNHTLTIKIRWLWVLFVLALWPHPHKTVYGDPITSMHTIQKVLPLPQTALQPVAEAQPVQVTASTPVVAPTASMDAKSYALSRVGSAQFSCLDSLWNKESGWRVNAYNLSGAYGIPQSLPASKMASAGADYLTNPITQVNWGLSYIQSVYGTPCGAWAHSVAYNWY